MFEPDDMAIVSVKCEQAAVALHRRCGDPHIVCRYRGAGAAQRGKDPCVVPDRRCGHRQYADKGLVEEITQGMPVLVCTAPQFETGFELAEDGHRHNHHRCPGDVIEDTGMPRTQMRVCAGVENESVSQNRCPSPVDRRLAARGARR